MNAYLDYEIEQLEKVIKSTEASIEVVETNKSYHVDEICRHAERVAEYEKEIEACKQTIVILKRTIVEKKKAAEVSNEK